MDFEQNSNISGSSGGGQGSSGPSYNYNPTKPVRVKKRKGWSIFFGILFGLSVLTNIMLFLMVFVIVAVVAAGKTSLITEKVLFEGPRTNKIAVINLYGLIESEMAEKVTKQIQYASEDGNVKAVILRVDSPGGTISGSDQIYNEILKLRNDSDIPVISFMRGIAASGGYYCSVACDEIIAEPTTITGSIGVIMTYLVFEEFLEGKLGISPVVVKSGQRKDWPSSFQKPSQEQLDYLQNKVIQPAFKRFVNIVSDGRTMLTAEDVNRLADGSIFAAQEALSERLIDSIGYFENAVQLAKDLAGLEKAQVVEYYEPFSFASVFGSSAKSVLTIDRKRILELSTPQVMYLWSIY
jgi:protease-4